MNWRICILALLLLVVVAGRVDVSVMGVNSNSSMDLDGINMEISGLVVTRNRIGVGTSVPSQAVHVVGSTFFNNTVVYERVDRKAYSIDWTAGNCQRMVITDDGFVGIQFTTPPTIDANLVLSVQYDSEFPGRMEVNVPSPNVIFWNLNVSTNVPISHNIDVLHFYFQKAKTGDAVSTYNGIATFAYRKKKKP